MRPRAQTAPGGQTPSPAALEAKQGRPRLSPEPADGGWRPRGVWPKAPAPAVAVASGWGMDPPELGLQALPGHRESHPRRAPGHHRAQDTLLPCPRESRAPSAAEAPPQPLPHSTPPLAPPLPQLLTTSIRWGLCKSWLGVGAHPLQKQVAQASGSPSEMRQLGGTLLGSWRSEALCPRLALLRL